MKKKNNKSSLTLCKAALCSRCFLQLMKNVRDGTGTDGSATLTDGEFGSFFQSDWVDQGNGEGNVIAWHDHIGSSWKSDVTSDIGGSEEELWSVTV